MVGVVVPHDKKIEVMTAKRVEEVEEVVSDYLLVMVEKVALVMEDTLVAVGVSRERSHRRDKELLVVAVVIMMVRHALVAVEEAEWQALLDKVAMMVKVG